MLNDEQRKMVEESIWVVNTALKKQGLECDKDLKQDALLCMCQCAERFDASKGIKWTTYAYKNVYLYIKRTHAKQNKKSAPLIKQDLFDMGDNIDGIQGVNIYDDPKYRLDGFMGVCSKNEKALLKAKLRGYTLPEIAKQLNCSAEKVNITVKSIKEKAREIIL